uniref:Semaphorin-4B-like n=1 Tax=Seriola lalandi dorsalis TaxID=1841481 RepID=A0A3B4X859_SERLL
MFCTSLLLSVLSCYVMVIFSLCFFSCCFPDAKERSAKRFSVDGVFNYTSLLLSQEDDMLYVGAREALFALSLSDISKTKLQKNLTWGTPAGKREECSFKGKNLETDCFNYIKILLRLNSTHLYVCGTYAFSPICAYIVSNDLSLCLLFTS